MVTYFKAIQSHLEYEGTYERTIANKLYSCWVIQNIQNKGAKDWKVNSGGIGQ